MVIRSATVAKSGGVNSPNVTLSGNLQQHGKMLTGGALNVNARDISNSGQLPGR